MDNKDKKQQKRDEKAPPPSRWQAYRRFFNRFALLGKAKRLARRLGTGALYSILLLFYAYKRKETPAWAKRTILGILGYFIAPIDALPDLTPIVGYTDDLGIVAFGLVAIAAYIDDEVRQKARNKVEQWLGEVDESEIEEVDKRL